MFGIPPPHHGGDGGGPPSPLAHECRSSCATSSPRHRRHGSPPISHLSLCPADTAPSAGKSSPADPAPLRIAPGMNRPPRSSGRAPGRSSSPPPEQPSFQAERNRRGGLAAGMRLCANEMNGGSEASTGVKLDGARAHGFRWALSK